jgi:hypothetical protein
MICCLATKLLPMARNFLSHSIGDYKSSRQRIKVLLGKVLAQDEALFGQQSSSMVSLF